MIKRLVFCAGIFLLALSATTAEAQRAVILMRHAEKVDDSTDAALSRAGEKRAARLVTQLKDLGITAIYTTPFQRTIKTAEPLARSIHVKPVVVAASDQPKLIQRIRTQNPKDVVLIVGHSNTLPAMIKELGAKEQVAIADDRFGDLFILVPATPNPILLRLHLVE